MDKTDFFVPGRRLTVVIYDIKVVSSSSSSESESEDSYRHIVDTAVEARVEEPILGFSNVINTSLDILNTQSR